MIRGLTAVKGAWHMNTVLSHALNLLTRALSHVEHAHRARRYAATHNQEPLEQGTTEIIEGISRLRTDLQTLLGGLRARASADGTER
jgi:hypothetical protein